MTVQSTSESWMYALELSRPLTDAGIQVELAAVGTPLSTAQRTEARSIPNLVLHESPHTGLNPEPWHELPGEGGWLLKLAAQSRPDIVHLNGFAYASLDWSAPVVVVAHSCALSWWKAIKGHEAPTEYAEYKMRVTHGIRRCSALVAPSLAMLESTRNLYGTHPRTQVIYHCRRVSTGTSTGKYPYVMSVGNLWDPAKNLRALDEAAGGIPFPVYVAGQYLRTDNDRRPARHLKALGNLSSEQIQQWLTGAGVFALPASYEPYGISALDAALAGCALVLSDIDSMREIWQDAAVYVSPDDPKALGAAIEELMSNGRLRDRYGKQARKRAVDFSTGQSASEYYQLYHDVLEEQEHLTPIGPAVRRNANRSIASVV